MNNKESLYQGFKDYFIIDREKIDYFLNVIKCTEDVMWEYECESVTLPYDEKHIKTLQYHNIKIIHTEKIAHDAFAAGSVFEDEVEVFVDDRRIFKTDDDENENATLLRQIITFVKHIEKLKR